MTRARDLLFVVLGGAIAAGCTVGSGSGKADGVIFQYDCIHAPGLDPAAPICYSLNPVYFAGVPTEDLSVTSIHTNEMHIRMQNNSLAVQYADTLFVDVINSYEVARCVRGRIDPTTGAPDYNLTEALPHGGSTWWCDWSGTASTDGGVVDGGSATCPGTTAGGAAPGPRIHLTPYTDVHASFATLSTCGVTKITGVAFDGWIAFEHFGGAEQPGKAPEARDPVMTNFVIQFGDKMRAHFHIVLGDQVVLGAQEDNLPPPRPSEIGGTLDGFFDFNLERGRSAQPFP